MGGGHESGDRPGREEQHPVSAGDDGHQSVHLPRGLPLPDDGYHGLACRGWHPGWLLLLRHHLEVRGRPPDLSDYLCQVEAGDVARLRMLGSAGNMPRSGVARLFFLTRWKAAASTFFFGGDFRCRSPLTAQSSEVMATK